MCNEDDPSISRVFVPPPTYALFPLKTQDLTRLRFQSLETTIIVDNSPMAYMFQPENAIDCMRYRTYYLLVRYNKRLMDAPPPPPPPSNKAVLIV